MNDWWVVLIFALAYGYPRLVAHELSHAVAAICTGGSVDWRRFAPYPHRVRCAACFGSGVYIQGPTDEAVECHDCVGTGRGRWVWGRMYRTGGDEMWVYLAPAGRASAFMVTWGVLAGLLYWPLAVFALWEATDIGHWWVGWANWEKNPYTDGAKARALLAAKRG